MARTNTIAVGWTHPETEEDFRVTLEVTPGSRGCRDEAPTGPEFDVIEVREDRPGGVKRPDLIALVDAELSGRFGDEAAEKAQEAEDDAYNDEMERRADSAREERMFGGR